MKQAYDIVRCGSVALIVRTTTQGASPVAVYANRTLRMQREKPEAITFASVQEARSVAEAILSCTEDVSPRRTREKAPLSREAAGPVQVWPEDTQNAG